MIKSKKIISVLSIMLAIVLLSMSSVTVFAATKRTVSKSISLSKGQNRSVTVNVEKNTNITINYDLGSNSASGTVCFTIAKQQWGPFYRSVYVKSVKANTSGTLTFKVDSKANYSVSVSNNSEKSALVMGTYKVTYYSPSTTHGGGGRSF